MSKLEDYSSLGGVPKLQRDDAVPFYRNGSPKLINYNNLRNSVDPSFSSQVQLYNILDYGATGNGTDNDSAALQAAIDAIETSGCIILPPGNYRLENSVSYTGKDVSFFGYGVDITTITIANTTGGIDINLTSHSQKVNASWLTLRAGAENIGYCIDISYNGSGSSNSETQLYFDKMAFVSAGELASSINYFDKHLILNNIKRAKISDVSFLGIATSPRRSTSCIEFSGTTLDVALSGLNFNRFETAVDVTGSCEGIQFVNTIWVNGKTAVKWNSDAPEPWLKLMGCHINTYHKGLDLKNLNKLFCIGNLFYVGNGDGGYGFEDNYYGIYVDTTANSSNVYKIAFNDFIMLQNDSTNKYGVYHEGSNSWQLSNAAGNSFLGSSLRPFNAAFRLDTGAVNNVISGNQYSSVDATIDDGGIGNFGFDWSTGGMRTANQINQSSEETTISSGSITLSDTDFYRVDTEADAATDDLTNIGAARDGREITLKAENNARTIVIKNSGNIVTKAGSDVSLDTNSKIIRLKYATDITKWIEV